MTEEERAYQEAQSEFNRISQVIGNVTSSKAKYEEKIAGLKDQLPDLFASAALDEGGREEIDDIKDSIRLLKERIEEIPITLKGLEKREGRCRHDCRVAYRALERLYKSAKERLSSGDESVGLVDELKSIAATMGINDHCERFLYELQRPK